MKERKKLLIRLYSRKSKYTQKGDSIENQVEMDMTYIKEHYPEDEYDVEIIVYEDDGWSGGTLERPKFMKMIKDNRKKPADILICYRLDRISRSISDFSRLIDEFSKLGTAFVSIKEQFDTSSPMRSCNDVYCKRFCTIRKRSYCGTY